MAFKVKVNVKSNNIKKKVKAYKKEAMNNLAKELKKQILIDINGGRSPVKGQGRFKKYSKSYLDAIKKGRYNEYGKSKRPVNLKLTGALLKSLFIKKVSNDLQIGFDNELFDIHNNKGAGKSKTIRRMLPTEQGETFNRSITLRIREVVNAVAKKIFG